MITTEDYMTNVIDHASKLTDAYIKLDNNVILLYRSMTRDELEFDGECPMIKCHFKGATVFGMDNGVIDEITQYSTYDTYYSPSDEFRVLSKEEVIKLFNSNLLTNLKSLL